MPTVQGTMSSQGHAQGVIDPQGNWLVVGSAAFAAKLAISYETADGAKLYVVPADSRLLIEQAFWEVSTDFTGGTSSAIGLASDAAPHETPGDLLGGAAGDVAASLVAGFAEGTPGASFSGAPGIVVLEAGQAIVFNRIASAFTAGMGYAHVVGRFIR